MGTHPIDPANLSAYHVLMIVLYMSGLFGFVYGVFGTVRTAATKLPVPANQATNDLFPLDRGRRLYHFDGKWRKAQKVATFAGLALFFGVTLAVDSYYTYLAGDGWFAWTPALSIWATAFIHWSVVLAATVPYAVRAYGHANQFRLAESDV